MYVCIAHACPVTKVVTVSDPLGLESQVVVITLWELGTEPDPLEKQQVLLSAEPSPALCVCFEAAS